jgi:hypothetical protein
MGWRLIVVGRLNAEGICEAKALEEWQRSAEQWISVQTVSHRCLFKTFLMFLDFIYYYLIPAKIFIIII